MLGLPMNGQYPFTCSGEHLKHRGDTLIAMIATGDVANVCGHYGPCQTSDSPSRPRSMGHRYIIFWRKRKERFDTAGMMSRVP